MPRPLERLAGFVNEYHDAVPTPSPEHGSACWRLVRVAPSIGHRGSCHQAPSGSLAHPVVGHSVGVLARSQRREKPWVVGTGYRPAPTRGDVVVAPVEIRIVSRRLSPSQCLTARAACAEGRPVEAGAGLPPGVLFMDPALDSTRTPPAEREPGAQVTRNDRDQEPGAGGRALVGNAPQGIESDGGDDGDVQQAASCDAWVIADHVRVPSSFTDPLCRLANRRSGRSSRARSGT